MDKITYLAELAEGLARWVPERERRDILRYYAEYFEEAGPGREAEVVAELGDPWALSCRLAVEGGYVSQEQANSWTPPKQKRWRWGPVAAVACVAIVAIVAMSVASAASTFGRIIGQAVSTSVVEQQVGVVASVDEVVPGMAEYDISFIHQDTESIAGFWTMKDGCLEAFDSIDVDVSLANIMVTEGEDYTLFVNQRAGLVGFQLTWEVKNGTLKIRDGGAVNAVTFDSWTDIPDDWRDMVDGLATIDVTITVPETAVLDGIDIQTGLGSVFLGGVAAKKVEAETGWGSINCYDLRQVVKKLDLETVRGDIVLGLDEPYSGAELSLETGKGNVEVSLGCIEADCAYKLETGVGSVSVNGAGRGSKAEQKGNMPYRLNAETGWGNMNIYFREDRW